MAALRRSGDGRARPTTWNGLLIVAMLVAMLVAGAVAPVASALADDHRSAAERSVAAPLAGPPGPAARPTTGSAAGPADTPVAPRPARQHVVLPPTADLNGVLRSMLLVITGVDVDTGAVTAAALAVTGLPVPAVVANGLLRIAAGTGPLVSARHLQGHLRA